MLIDTTVPPLTVLINSKNRVSGTDEDFSYRMPINFSHMEYDAIAVTSILVPKSYYVIEEGRNTFTLYEDGTPITITIPIGNYGVRAFENTLQTILNSSTINGLTYTIQFPDSTSSPNTGKWRFVVNTNSITIKLNVGEFVYEQLGFERNTEHTFTVDGTDSELYSTNVIKLQREDALVLHSDIMNSPSGDILQTIFAQQDPTFSSIVWNATNIETNWRPIRHNASNAYRFTLTNESNQIVHLNGQNLIISIMVFRMNKAYRKINGYINYLLSKDDE